MAWVGRFDDFAEIGGFDQSRTKNAPTFQRRQHGGNSHNQTQRYSDNFSVPHQQFDGVTPIENISSTMQSASIAGVVIAREGPRTIISKKGSGNERHLLCLTVRDGPMSFINITCWGGQEYASFLHSKTSIGEVIEIKGAQVQDKSNPSDEKFKPWTPSPCQLSVSENQGSVSPLTGRGLETYINLLHMPTRADNDYCTLDDIQTNGINLQGERVNILAVIKKVWPVKDITTKTGKKTSKVDVVLCDETCMDFNLTLWDSFVELAEKWIPMETVIFASDVKIMYNDYRSTMTASSDSKSIFTTDPDIGEAHRLLNVAKGQTSFVTGNTSDTQFTDDTRDPDLNSITNVLTVQEAKSLRAEVSAYNGRNAYGVLNVFLSHFDVDGEEKSCLRNVCSKCHKTVHESSGFICGNSACPGADVPFDNQVEYNFSLNLSDHTGTLESCYLQPKIAEQLLGCKAQEFSSLPLPQKTGMKWIYLLEKCKAVIKLRKGNGKGSKTFITVLALEKMV